VHDDVVSVEDEVTGPLGFSEGASQLVPRLSLQLPHSPVFRLAASLTSRLCPPALIPSHLKALL
jgi:hypothetical protein